MIFHTSIRARHPQPVADGIAEIWDGRALPFEPNPDAWIVFADDDNGSCIEVHPWKTVLTPGDNTVKFARTTDQAPHSAAHLALASERDDEELLAIAAKYDWPARRCNRGWFDLVELWVENSILIEVLTPEMQADYRRSMNPGTWIELLHEQGIPTDSWESCYEGRQESG